MMVEKHLLSGHPSARSRTRVFAPLFGALTLGALTLGAVAQSGDESFVATHVVEVSASSCLQLRVGPGPKTSPLECLASGTEVEFLLASDDWSRVRTPRGKIGWVVDGSLRPVPAVSAAAPATEPEASAESPRATTAAVDSSGDAAESELETLRSRNRQLESELASALADADSARSFQAQATKEVPALQEQVAILTRKLANAEQASREWRGEAQAVQADAETIWALEDELEALKVEMVETETRTAALEEENRDLRSQLQTGQAGAATQQAATQQAATQQAARQPAATAARPEAAQPEATQAAVTPQAVAPQAVAQPEEPRRAAVVADVEVPETPARPPTQVAVAASEPAPLSAVAADTPPSDAVPARPATSDGVPTGAASAAAVSPQDTGALPDPLNAVQSWARAWQDGDVAAYIGHYAENFVPLGGTTHADWIDSSRRTLERQRSVVITLTEVEVEQPSDPHQRTVRFRQRYEAETFSDAVTKVLDLQWQDGGWRIVDESTAAR